MNDCDATVYWLTPYASTAASSTGISGKFIHEDDDGVALGNLNIL